MILKSFRESIRLGIVRSLIYFVNKEHRLKWLLLLQGHGTIDDRKVQRGYHFRPRCSDYEYIPGKRRRNGLMASITCGGIRQICKTHLKTGIYRVVMPSPVHMAWRLFSVFVFLSSTMEGSIGRGLP